MQILILCFILPLMTNDLKTYCSYLWDSLCVRPDARLIPCCVYKDYPHSAYIDTSPDGLLNALNSAVFKDLRQKALTNTPIKGCQTCYTREESSGHSKRIGANKAAQEKFTGLESELKSIVHLELFLSNKCNLKCSMCSPELSLPLAQDYIKLGIVTEKYKIPIENNYSKQIKNFKNLRYLKFVGGEPLLSEAHEQLLEAISFQQAQNIELEYATNCTIYPSAKILEYWSKFAGIKIILSLDGHQKTNEYIRYPSVWEEVAQNAIEYRRYAEQNKKVTLGINSVVSLYNILSLNPFLDWVNENLGPMLDSKGYSTFTLNPIRHPSFLSLQHLSNDLKIKVSQLYPRNKQTAAIYSVLNMTAVPSELERLLDFTQSFDQLRGIHVQNYIPEFAMILTDITTTNRDWRQSII